MSKPKSSHRVSNLTVMVKYLKRHTFTVPELSPLLRSSPRDNVQVNMQANLNAIESRTIAAKRDTADGRLVHHNIVLCLEGIKRHKINARQVVTRNQSIIKIVVRHGERIMTVQSKETWYLSSLVSLPVS